MIDCCARKTGDCLSRTEYTVTEDHCHGYTYLITGATSDVGTTLIARLLEGAPADTLVLAQGCGDVEKLASLLPEIPGSGAPL